MTNNRNTALASAYRTGGMAMSVGIQPVEQRPTLARWFFSLERNLMYSALVLIGLICMPLHSQNITADVLGTVTDPSGAVVANATVNIQDMGTHAERSTVTNQSGDYIFSLLPVGNYSVTITATGFKPYKLTGIAASAGARVRADAKLSLGVSTQTVEVEASAPIVQTDSSTVGGSVSQQTLQNIPLNGRNLTNLVTQQPGINAGTPNNTQTGQRPDDRRQTSAVSANGQEEYYNSNTLDGVDNNERFYGLVVVKPSVEAVQEIQVQTGNFNADVGRAAGASVSVITKSGTNQFHGSAFEFFRNDVLDAREYYTPTTSKNQEWRQNQFGGSIGGPIIRDKTFFFFALEELRLVQGINSPQQLVPSAGDHGFVASLGAHADPIGLKIFNLYPMPNSGTNGYVSSPAKTLFTTTYDAKVDHHFSAKDQIFFRYDYNPTTAFFPGFFPKCVKGSCGGDSSLDGINPVGAGFIANGAFPGTSQESTYSGQVNYTHLFSSNLVMELRTGFSRIKIDSQPINAGTNAGTKLGIPNSNITADPRANGMPGFHFLDGSADLGDQIAYPIVNVGNNFQWNGDVIYTKGTQSIKMGASLIRRQLNYFQDWEPQGWFFFLNVIPGLSAPDAMVAGIPPVVAIRQNTYTGQYSRAWEPSAFVQDDWHALPWLTLNLGFRYDVFLPFVDIKNRVTNFDFNHFKFITGGTGGIQADYGNASPRVGFAAQLPHTHGLVLRGGFGVVYYPGDSGNEILLQNLPYVTSVSCSPLGHTCPAGVGTLAQGPPLSPAYTDPNVINTVTDHSYSVNGKQLNWRSSYLEEYNLTLQKQLGANAITLAYVGSLGRRQSGPAWNLNAPQPSPDGVVTLVNQQAPYYYNTQYLGLGGMSEYLNEGTSNYNAMQLIFERRVAKGLNVNANYTWSHGLDNWGGVESFGSMNPWRLNWKYNYGNSDIDIKDRIAFTFNYELPFAKTLTGAGGYLLKGWSLSSSSYWQTGLPFTVLNSYSPPATSGGAGVAPRPNVVVGQSFYAANQSLSVWLNRNAFPAAPDALWSKDSSGNYTSVKFGNEGVNQIFGPHLRQFDLAAGKEFPIGESLKAQFRAECFNISNTPNFSNPVNDLNNPQFGQITSNPYGMFPRVYQFAMKFQF